MMADARPRFSGTVPLPDQVAGAQRRALLPHSLGLSTGARALDIDGRRHYIHGRRLHRQSRSRRVWGRDAVRWAPHGAQRRLSAHHQQPNGADGAHCESRAPQSNAAALRSTAIPGTSLTPSPRAGPSAGPAPRQEAAQLLAGVPDHLRLLRDLLEQPRHRPDPFVDEEAAASDLSPQARSLSLPRLSSFTRTITTELRDFCTDRMLRIDSPTLFATPFPFPKASRTARSTSSNSSRAPVRIPGRSFDCASSTSHSRGSPCCSSSRALYHGATIRLHVIVPLQYGLSAPATSRMLVPSSERTKANRTPTVGLQRQRPAWL